MKFRYYITDLGSGMVVGTNDKQKADNFATSIDYFVVDAEKGEWITEDGSNEDIQEAK